MSLISESDESEESDEFTSVESLTVGPSDGTESSDSLSLELLLELLAMASKREMLEASVSLDVRSMTDGELASCWLDRAAGRRRVTRK